MISAQELAVQKALTAAFVSWDTETLTITPAQTRSADGAGGWTYSQGPSFIEAVRLVAQGDRPQVQTTVDGRWERVEYVMVGMPEVAERVGRGDTFTFKGRTYRVSAIHETPPWVFRADCTVWEG